MINNQKKFDAQGSSISNLANPRDKRDAVNYLYLRDLLLTVTFAIYNALPVSTKNVYTKTEWNDKFIKKNNWDEMFKM